MDNFEMPAGEQPPTPPRKKRGWLVAVIVLVVLGAAGTYLWRAYGPTRGLTATIADAGPDAGPADAGAPQLMSLAEGDALLRKLAAGWSKSKDLARWLMADDIIHRLTAAVNMVAEGDSPAPVLGFVKIEGEFDVNEEAPKGKKAKRHVRKKQRPPPMFKGKLFIAPESYARYDAVTNAFTSVDPAVAGAAYAQLRPYFDTAFTQIGRPGKRFDDVLSAAIHRLVSAKLLEGKVEVVPKGAVYAFKDPALEHLSAAEKLLLRMGPKNGKAVQTSLSRFADAAGLAK